MQKKKTAIVTGGSSGMGLSISQKLKQLGINVIVFDIQPLPEEFVFFT